MASRVLAVKATLSVGGEAYRVLSYSLRQALGEVGALDCEIAQDDRTPPDPADLCGKNAELTLAIHEATGMRSYAGLIAWAERLPAPDDVRRVRLRVVPAMWRLSKRADCRTFLKKSVVDVVKHVLSGALVTAQKWHVTGSYPVRDYVVQYRETDLQFITRLCAEEGLYYWVNTDDGQDTVHFSDNPKGVGPASGAPSLVFRHEFGDHEAGDYVMHLTRTRRVRPDRVTVRDYDPERPKLDLDANAESPDEGPHTLEVYHYPGRCTDPSALKRRAKVLLAALQQSRDIVRGEAGNLSLEPGKHFAIEGHPLASLNEEFLVTAIEIEGAEARAFEIAGKGGLAREFSFAFRFEGVPTKTTDYRMPRTKASRTMPGMQTAVVSGSPGEEIHVDAGAHVKIQFPWDRVGKKNDESSRWVRTSQLALGGGMLVPRVGWEVAVRFSEGDANDPYVMARLYNGTSAPPYALPAHKGRGSIQTATSPGGGSTNEFHMSDEKGNEVFMMNASKNMTVDVGNDMTQSIGNNSERKVTGNLDISVTNSASASVGAKQSVTVGGSQTVHVETLLVDQVAGNHTLAIGGDRTMMVGGDHKRDVGGDSALTVNGMMLDAVLGDVTDSTLGAMSQTVGAALVELAVGGRSYVVGGSRNELTGAIKIIASKGGRAIDVGQDFGQKVGGLILHSVTKDEPETAGQTFMQVAGGAQIVKAQNVTYEAESALTLVMGASTILMNPAMVTIAGVSLKYDGDVADQAALILDN